MGDIQDKLEGAAGKAKEVAGDLADNKKLENEGKAEQVLADVKEKASEAVDAVKDKANEVIGKFKDN